ncbi:hypothetical protein CH276_14150 [Rhodococcus sp. 06-470-2]|uniref:hypothetical protein n=1 Tax=unclassified Rhodococcus (in: high G+C Gram-positive bacteria) TaxID=192944 RepID=UPI000B9ACCCC|nr:MULTISPECIES: hypothetical protein [unclassified Rhodococcus (in: high G+C Gram-positive bacteria)]OZC62758.1 hypothetical protein CH276_14150 [Rhodococcus sp. 06-470-2]OZE71735.1 hypothetical protein CH265_01630 [Rhodococcus sp. 05-2221-1B]
MSDIIDDIDALVDWQMEQESSGYDHNINQAECRICGGQWHGLAITEAMRKLRIRYQSAEFYADFTGFREPLERVLGELDAYRHADDDSELLCPGSEFIGPWATKSQLYVLRTVRRAVSRALEWNHDPRQLDLALYPPASLPVTTGVRPINGEVFVIGREGQRMPLGHSASIVITDEARELERRMFAGRQDPVRIVTEAYFSVPAGSPMARWIAGEPDAVSEHDRRVLRNLTDDAPTTPRQRALPQPSTTPPMWAHDPTRSRRPRRNRNQPTRQGIA